MDAKWKVLAETSYEKFKIFEIKKSTRVNPRTNKAVDFVRIDGLDWVNVIPFTPDGKVLLIRQYRHGSEEYTLEIPGGCVEIGEDPAASGLRELREETGYSAASIEFLGTIKPNPALQSNRLYCYYAKDVVPATAQELDPGEDIRIVLMPVEEVWEGLKNGQIDHALVTACFGLYLLNAKK